MFESFAPFEIVCATFSKEKRKCLIIMSKALNKFRINSKHSEWLSADLYTQHTHKYANPTR